MKSFNGSTRQSATSPALLPAAVLAVLMSLAWSAQLRAQESAFRYDPDKIEVGTVYHYTKSNIDGSHAGPISLYVADKDKLEALKWHEGDTRATLVKATLDWDRFSVSHFETLQLVAGQDPQTRAVLDYNEDLPGVVASVGEAEFRVPIKTWPWHSYDFDFASLNFAWRHLVDPERPFTIGIVDVVRDGDDGPQLAEKGTVDIAYQQDAERHGHQCRQYSVDGPGLENKGGNIWVRKSDGVLIDYEIELPDEPGYENGKLQLKSVEHMTPEEWAAFKQNCLQGAEGK